MNSNHTQDLIRRIDEWYQYRCDGEWEHRYGMMIETCDNPGWQVTFKDLPLPNSEKARIQKTLLKEHGAETILEGTSVRLFARSFQRCLQAAVALIELSDQHYRRCSKTSPQA